MVEVRVASTAFPTSDAVCVQSRNNRTCRPFERVNRGDVRTGLVLSLTSSDTGPRQTTLPRPAVLGGDATTRVAFTSSLQSSMVPVDIWCVPMMFLKLKVSYHAVSDLYQPSNGVANTSVLSSVLL